MENNKQTTEQMLQVVKEWHTYYTVSAAWNDFVESIKYKNRYFSNTEFEKYIEILFDYKEKINQDSIFYRARIIKPNDIKLIKVETDIINDSTKSGINGFDKDNMKAPPKELAISGRANPAGVSYLYLASNPQTACAETRLNIFDLISVSRFSAAQDLTIINLKSNDISKLEGTEKIIRYNFLSKIQNAFSMPNNERNDIEYSPSQYISAYLQNRGIDGIKYGSMNDTKSESYNIVLFNPELTRCIDEWGEVYRCVEKKLVVQNISKLDITLIKTSAGPSISKENDIKKIKQNLIFNQAEADSSKR